MKVAIVSDHRGYELKKYIKKNLKNIELIDLGTDSINPVDYPDYAFKLCDYIKNNKCLGIAICGSGIGMSIACNKVKGIRCARVNSIKDTIITRKDNNSNVIALSSDINQNRVLRIIEEFVSTDFSKEERHVRRINKIKEYEK